MANRYCVSGGGGVWHASASWSTTSNGAGGASIPGASDTVYLDAYSVNLTLGAAGAASSVVTAGYTGKTLDLNDQDLTCAGAFNHTAGTVLGGTGNLSCGGSVTLSGTFTCETGTLTITGTSTLTTGGNSLYKMTANMGTSVLTIAGGTCTVTNTYTHTASGAVNGQSLTLQGDIVLTDTAIGGTTTITISGGANQAISGAGGLFPGAAITVNKSGGTVTQNAAVTCPSTLTLNGTGASGWDMNDQNLTVTSAFVANYASFTFSYGSGSLTLVTNLTVTSVSAWNYETGTTKFTNDNPSVSVGTYQLNHMTWDAVTGGTLTVTGTCRVNGNLTKANKAGRIQTGTVALYGNLITTSTFTISSVGSGTIEFSGTNHEIYCDKAGGTGTVGAILKGSHSGTITVYDHIKSWGGNYNIILNTGAWDFTTNTSEFECAIGSSAVNGVQGSATVTFYKLTLNSTQIYQVQFSTVVVANTFTITTAGNVNVSASGSLNLQGDVVLNDASVGGTLAVNFTGGNAQQISGTGGGLPGGTITVNKTAGSTLTMTIPLNLSTAGQDLTVSSGILDMNDQALTIADVFTVSGANASVFGGTGILTVGGAFTYVSGAIDMEGGTLVFTSGVAHAISIPAGGLTVNNITFGATSTHTFTAGRTLTVGGTMNSNGAKGATASLLRSSTPGTHYHFILNGTSNVLNKVDVADCDGSGGATVPIRALGSKNSLGNTSWKFGAGGAKGEPRGVLRNVYTNS